MDIRRETELAFIKKNKEIENLKRLNASLSGLLFDNSGYHARLRREFNEQKDKTDKYAFYLILCNLAWCGISIWHWF